MIEIIRKSFTPKKLAFLVTFALLSHGFCVNSFAGTTDGADANADAAVYSSIEDYQVAGNASTEDSSSQVGEKVASIALSENTDLLIADKSDGKTSDADSDTSLIDSIPDSDSAFDFQNNTVESTYDNAIGIVEFESSIILEDAIVSDSSLETDELSSGAASEIGEDVTNSDSETETTTEKGRSSRRGSLGSGKSSGRAAKDTSDNEKGNGSSDANDSKKTGNDDPDRKGTDTPDAQLDRSNDDNHSGREESTNPNGNGLNGSGEPKKGNDGFENGNLPNADNDDDSANDGKAFVGVDNGANGAHSVDVLPQTGSAVDTGTITLCGLAFIAIGILLAKKKQKA